MMGLVKNKRSKKPNKTLISKWWDQIALWREQDCLKIKRGEEDPQIIKPQEGVKAVYEATRGEAFVTSDVGQHQMFAALYYPFDEPRKWINSGGLGTMGFGLPSAMGAQIAFPESTVVCITGEGSIQMCIQELSTCTQYNLPIKVININNYISHILPETKGTAYEDATVRNVLDMSIASGFIEDYTGQAEIFKKYRSSTGWDLPETNSTQTVKGLHDFLSSMPKSNQKHGKKYHYCSPHSDLLGWIIERASGENYSKIMADLLFKKAGINHEANVTVDKWGASRAAGGISVSPYDLLLLSELVRNHGSNKNGQVIPAAWIEDFVNNKNLSLIHI